MGNNLRERVAATTGNAPATTGGEVAERKPATLAEQIESMSEKFQLAMPRGMEARQLIRDAMSLMRLQPNLAKCDSASVLGGLMTFAQLGLRPGVLGHGWLIPFKSRKQINKQWVDVWSAQIVIGYKGYAELVHRSGQATTMVGRTIHANDTFELEYGIDEKLVHKPCMTGCRGEVIGYYAVIKYQSGGYVFWHMTVPEAQEWRDRYAMARKRIYENGKPTDETEIVGPWRDNFDEMAIKTCFLRAQRWAPKATDSMLARAAEVDGAVRTDLDLNPDAMYDAPHPEYDFDGEVVPDGDPIPEQRSDERPPPPPVRDVGTPAAAAAPQLQTEFPPVPGNGDDDPATKAQLTAIGRLLALPDPDRLAVVARLVGMTRPLTSTSKLTKREAGRVIEIVSGWKEAGTFDAQIDAVLAVADTGGSAAATTAELPRPGTKAWHDDRHPIRTEDGPIVRVPTVMNGDCSICIELDEEADRGQ